MKSIYEQVEKFSQASKQDILEIENYLNKYETPLSASEQYANDKSKGFENEGYYLRYYKFFFLKYMPVTYIG